MHNYFVNFQPLFLGAPLPLGALSALLFAKGLIRHCICRADKNRQLARVNDLGCNFDIFSRCK